MKQYIVLAAAVLGLMTANAKTTIEIKNVAKFSRAAEMVEIPAEDLIEREGKSFDILDGNGRIVPWQITSDNTLIFPVSIGPKSRVKYTIQATETPAPIDTIAYGRLFPERADDMTWENDHAAYRAYGPALQRSGERAFGYDVWCKSVKYPVIEERYLNNNRRGKSFHKDWGDGLDVYSVGPTLGGGTAALLDDNGQIIYPYCWKESQVLDNGPLRFKVRLVYNPVEIDGNEVVETRVITLDAGDFLNKAEITYDGLAAPRDCVEGIVVHKENPGAFLFNDSLSTVAYEDLTDNPDAGNGKIYVGIVSPEATKLEYMPLDESRGSAIGHAAAKVRVRPGVKSTYYFGSGWSKAGVPDLDTWQTILANKARSVAFPLLVKMKY